MYIGAVFASADSVADGIVVFHGRSRPANHRPTGDSENRGRQSLDILQWRLAGRAEGSLNVPRELLRQDGPAMQGHHYAFLKDAAYRDVRMTFEVRLQARSDAGVIFGAGAPGRNG
jgi:hypothetical protein